MDENQKIQDEFISTVSHELRTPLTSIRGFAQTMLSSWDKLDDESKKKFLAIIEEQSNRLIGLVENLLYVPKIQNSCSGICRCVDLNKTIEPAWQIVKNKYNQHNFVSEFNKKIPEVYVDCDKLQQIVINLLENAAKYSNENTTIKLTTGFSNQEEYVSLKVKDEGIGIKEEDFDKIFKKFARLENHLTSKVQGSGLGLYITKLLVEKMNGKISLESSPNGTTFEVLLPINNVEKQAREKCLPKH